MRRFPVIAGACLLSFAVGAGVGWWRKPAKVETKVVSVAVSYVDDSMKWYVHENRIEVTKDRTRIVRVVEQRPDGTSVDTTTTDVNVDTSSGSTSDSGGEATHSAGTASSTTSTTVTTSARPDWSLGLGAQWRPSDLSPTPHVYDAELSRRIVGGVWLGVTATASPSDLGSSTVGLRARVEW